MFAAPRESCRGLLAATYPLVFASPELQHSASVFLNSSFSTLSRYDPRPGMKKNLSGSVSSVTALVDSGADVHILSYEGALKMFLDVRPSALRVVGVNGSSTRAACQGSLVVQVRAPSGTCHRIDLGTAHAMKSCPTNLLSLCSSVSFLVLQFTIVQYNISLIISVSSSHIEIGESWLLGKDRDN